MRRLAVLSLACALAASLAAQPGRMQAPPTQGHPLLRKMVEAEGTLSYSGRRIVEFRVGPDRVRNIEIVLRDGWNMRTEFEPASANAGEIIVENRTQRWHFFPGPNEIHVLPPRREEMQIRLRRLLMGRARIEETHGGDIAGVATRQLTFTDPRGNVLQRLWVHLPTGMALKREMFDPLGARIGSFEFTRVNFRPELTPEDFSIQRRGAVVVTMADQVRRVARRLEMRPVRLPESEPYELEAVRPMDLAGRRVMVQVYLGERGRLTLFQVAGALDRERMRSLLRPGMFSRTWRTQGSTFVLMGDVGQAELDRLAARMR